MSINTDTTTDPSFACIDPRCMLDDLAAIMETVKAAPPQNREDVLHDFQRKGQIAGEILAMRDRYA
jgi:hypothetical protein